MLNYIKSEFYRITHTRGLYLGGGSLLALAVLFHAAVYYVGTTGSRYATTSYSYSNLVASPMVFSFFGMLIVLFLYDKNRESGNLKNAVASGIPRTKIFLGECIVGAVTATVLMLATVAVWIFCAETFLERTGPVTRETFLAEIPAVYLIALAGLISAVYFLEMIEAHTLGFLVWLAVWGGFPRCSVISDSAFRRFISSPSGCR